MHDETTQARDPGPADDRPFPAPSENGGCRSLANPYLAGVALGLTLTASYLLLGAGLGASGGLARLTAFALERVAPGYVAASAYLSSFGEHPLAYYLVTMVAGVFAGGLASAAAGRRIRPGLEKGRLASPGLRAGLAVLGGILSGFAARLAGGCTSGQALSGGALLLTGSLTFLAALFVAGYLVAPLAARQWKGD